MTRSRTITIGVGLLLLLGVGCLNFTKGMDFDYHVAVAREKGFPEPSRGLFYAGVILTVGSAYVLGRRARS